MIDRLTLRDVYRGLLDAYGPQGWWPLLDFSGSNPTKTGGLHGYHPGDYTFPHTEEECFEICIGAILTQNTAWPNVEQALRRLRQRIDFVPGALLALPLPEVRDAIRPSGYYNVKAEKLRRLAVFHRDLHGRVPAREELLAVWGVGPETADSIRLYAFGQIEMVMDAYTRRVLDALGFVPAGAPLEEARTHCIRQLPRSLPVYQEFHALMVEHGKRCYSRRPYRDPLFGR